MQAADKSTIFVTGGAGFIGSHVVEQLLAAGSRVRILDNFSTGHLRNLPPGIEDSICIGDCTNKDWVFEKLKGCDGVIHLAATPNVQKSLDDPPAILRNNMMATACVLEAARRLNIRRVVLASSASLYGADVTPPHHEEMTPSPANPYAVAKYTDEALARVYSQIFGVDTVCLRFFNVYGPRQDPSSPYSGVISIFCRRMLAGQAPVIFGDGLQSRDFIYVGDIARACIAAALSERTFGGSVVNAGTGKPTNLRELVEALNEILGTDLQPQFDAARKGEVRHSCADVERARELLEFSASEAFRDGLAKTVEWMQTQTRDVVVAHP